MRASFEALGTSEEHALSKETTSQGHSVQPTYQLLFFPYFHAGGESLFVQVRIGFHHLRSEPGAFLFYPQFSAGLYDVLESFVEGDFVLSFVDERTHGVGDMDFVRKDDETVHRAPPLYQFFPKCVPGEDAVGVRQDEAVNG